MANRGPLPTAYTAPSSCLASLSNVYALPVGHHQVGPFTTAGCFPDNYVADREAYFSPAFACPGGYSNVFQTTRAFGIAVETAVICCPPSMSYNPTSDQFTWYKSLGCTRAYTVQMTQLVTAVDDNGASLSLSLYTGGGGANAFSYQLRFQQTDLVPTSTTTTASTSMTQTGGDLPTTSSESGDGTGPGLSRGAAAGVGVGVTVAVLIAAFVGWKIRAGRYAARARSQAPDVQDAGATPKWGVEMDTRPADRTPAELGGPPPPAEMGTTNYYNIAPNHYTIYEIGPGQADGSGRAPGVGRGGYP